VLHGEATPATITIGDVKPIQTLLRHVVQPEEGLPLILVGAGKTLQLRNVAVLGAASLPACLHLGAGESRQFEALQLARKGLPWNRRQTLDAENCYSTCRCSICGPPRR
jgi:hypothetical protein